MKKKRYCSGCPRSDGWDCCSEKSAIFAYKNKSNEIVHKKIKKLFGMPVSFPQKCYSFECEEKENN